MIRSRLLGACTGIDHGFSATGSLNQSGILFPQQVHGNTVAWVDDGLKTVTADGLLTKSTAVVIGVKTADCVPIVLYEPCARIAGIVHAGWRGTAKGIALSAIRKICRAGGSGKDVRAAFGPSIGMCCFEVGSDVADMFNNSGKDVVAARDGKLYVNLALANYNQLVSAGVQKFNIDSPIYCTLCQCDRFPSYRRGESAQAIVSFITMQDNYYLLNTS